MGRVVFILLFAISTLTSSPVMNFVEEIISKDSFRQHRSLIRKIFQDEQKFQNGKQLKILSILNKLKTNGILKVFLKRPHSIQISFQGAGNPIFFMKLISDSLQDLGYFKYRILEATRDKKGFVWKIEFISDYILDPTLLYSSLAKKNCRIIDIERKDLFKWNFVIETKNAKLNILKLKKNKRSFLKTPVFDYWLNVSNGTKLKFSSKGNKWHPYISFYDKNLNLIKVFKRNKKTLNLNINIPRKSKYIRVTDIYLLNNIKNGLRVLLK